MTHRIHTRRALHRNPLVTGGPFQPTCPVFTRNSFVLRCHASYVLVARFAAAANNLRLMRPVRYSFSILAIYGQSRCSGLPDTPLLSWKYHGTFTLTCGDKDSVITVTMGTPTVSIIRWTEIHRLYVPFFWYDGNPLVYLRSVLERAHGVYDFHANRSYFALLGHNLSYYYEPGVFGWFTCIPIKVWFCVTAGSTFQ